VRVEIAIKKDHGYLNQLFYPPTSSVAGYVTNQQDKASRGHHHFFMVEDELWVLCMILALYMEEDLREIGSSHPTRKVALPPYEDSDGGEPILLLSLHFHVEGTNIPHHPPSPPQQTPSILYVGILRERWHQTRGEHTMVYITITLMQHLAHAPLDGHKAKYLYVVWILNLFSELFCSFSEIYKR